MPSPFELFRAKLETRGDHEVWIGARDRRGVGMVRIDGKLSTVQRAAWEFAHGPLAHGLRVRSCADERACVRLEHLSISPSSPATAGRRRTKGSGSIRETRPGVWRIAVADGTTAAGRRQRRTTTIHGTRADAEHMLARLLHAVARDDLGDLRVRELVGRYLADTDVAGAAARDHDILRRVIEPTIGDDLAAIVTPADVEAALDTVARQDPGRRGDARDALRLLRRAYQWARRRRWCEADPTADINTRWLGR